MAPLISWQWRSICFVKGCLPGSMIGFFSFEISLVALLSLPPTRKISSESNNGFRKIIELPLDTHSPSNKQLISLLNTSCWSSFNTNLMVNKEAFTDREAAHMFQPSQLFPTWKDYGACCKWATVTTSVFHFENFSIHLVPKNPVETCWAGMNLNFFSYHCLDQDWPTGNRFSASPDLATSWELMVLRITNCLVARRPTTNNPLVPWSAGFWCV